MNKPLLLMIPLILAVMVSGCTQTPNQNTNDNQPIDNQDVGTPAETNYSGVVCSTIEGVLEREACQQQQTEESNTRYLNEAIANMDYKKCGMIQSGSLMRQSCYLRVAEGTLNVSLCGASYAVSSTTCYEYITQRAGKSACDVLPAGYVRDECYSSATEGNVDLAECQAMATQQYRYTCYSNLASRTGDISVCENIDYTDSKYSCYVDVARANKDASLCGRIQDNTKKDQCYYLVAKDNNDTSICPLISGSLKNSCLSGFKT